MEQLTFAIRGADKQTKPIVDFVNAGTSELAAGDNGVSVIDEHVTSRKV